MNAQRFRLTSDSAALWNRFLDRSSGADFYHGAAYHQFAERQGEGEPWLVVFDEGDRFLAWPYLRRPIEGTGNALFDATAVYGYTGPVGAGDVHDPVFSTVPSRRSSTSGESSESSPCSAASTRCFAMLLSAKVSTVAASLGEARW